MFYYLIVIAQVGHWISHALHPMHASGFFTIDFLRFILYTSTGHPSEQVSSPEHLSMFIFGFGMFVALAYFLEN